MSEIQVLIVIWFLGTFKELIEYGVFRIDNPIAEKSEDMSMVSYKIAVFMIHISAFFVSCIWPILWAFDLIKELKTLIRS